MKKIPLLAVIAALFSLSMVTRSQASPIFDNSINSAGLFTETRGAGSMFGAVVHMTSNVTIQEIAAQVRANSTGSMKFLIFDSASGDGGWAGSGALLFSQTIAVTASAGPVGYLYSGAMSFTLLAGHTYDIGVLGTVSLTGVWDTTGDTQGSFTSYSNNANFGNFASPSTGGYSGVDPHILLFTTPVSAAVPEAGSTLALLSLGLLGLGLKRRRA